MSCYAALLVAVARRTGKHRNSRLRCDCMGYWFPHRRGGGACDGSPTRDHHVAKRCGVDLQPRQG